MREWLQGIGPGVDETPRRIGSRKNHAPAVRPFESVRGRASGTMYTNGFRPTDVLVKKSDRLT